MEIYQMQYVLAVAEELSFSKAAGRLCVTQPAISKQIKKLEDELQIAIFDRNQKKVAVTEKGQEFIDQIRGICESYEMLLGWVAQNSTQKRQIRFGTSQFYKKFIEEGINKFVRKNKNYDVQITVEGSPELIDKVRYELLDFALVDLPNKKSVQAGLNVIHISDLHLCAVVSPDHRFSGETSVRIEDFANETILLRSKKTGIYYDLLSLFKKHNVPLNLEIEPDLDKHFDRIRNGSIALVKLYTSFFQENGFVVIPVDPPVVTESAIVTSVDRVITDSDKQFIEAIGECY